jgi:hypothetical protein
MWSSDEQRRAAFVATIEGRTPDNQRQSTRMLRPLLGALGYIGPGIDEAGRGACRDLLRSAPPMLVGARLAGSFRGLSPERRGHTLLATMGATCWPQWPSPSCCDRACAQRRTVRAPG